ncbi:MULTISPECIES: type II toxin-antitoxin system RelE/ParE family toxin [unclassified Roseitalea]|uniref:type II toxin-antitoxin system RelE/ParE family toxin n=1 Tax=unclassified Roseitalea TaxID=2639107 RepID=UPI00273FC2BE|nr:MULTISPECIES: type II toxin-antitoxin system RelE/ParE family toxin [unclassified Roseitalea]
MAWTIRIDDDAARDIRKLPNDLQARFDVTARLIEESGLEALPYHYVKHIEGNIWELRLKARSGIGRVFYFTVLPENLIVLSAFKKTSQKTPRKEIDKARRRWRAKQ